MEAYTYSIKHLTNGNIYYGCRKSKTFDLGLVYFSSSKIVKKLILDEGLSNFSFKLRRKFSSYEEARIHETKLLRRIKAVSNNRVYNQAITSPMLPSKDNVAEEKRRKSISKGMLKRWQDKNYRSKFPKEFYSNMAKCNKRTRSNKPKVFKDVQIVRNGIVKNIKRNQLAAYKKIGYNLILN